MKPTKRRRATCEYHGMKWTAEYAAWRDMKARCMNPKNKNFNRYGGRGIKVYKSWINSFNAFLSHVGKKPFPKAVLDRIDNEGNYEPGNLRWVDMKTQCINRSNTNWIEFRGERLSASDWSRRLSSSQSLVANRLRLGWSVEKALTTPQLRSKSAKY